MRVSPQGLAFLRSPEFAGGLPHQGRKDGSMHLDLVARERRSIERKILDRERHKRVPIPEQKTGPELTRSRPDQQDHIGSMVKMAGYKIDFRPPEMQSTIVL